MSDQNVDSDGDGSPDVQDPGDSGMHDMWGNDIKIVDGVQLTETTDIFGNTVWVDSSRDVQATVQPDGDIYMEHSGVTYTPMEGEVGWDQFHGTDGSVLTESVDTSGLTGFQSSGGGADNGGGTSGDNTAGQDNSSGDSQGGQDGGDQDNRNGQSRARTDRRGQQEAVRVVDEGQDERHERRERRSEGLSCTLVGFILLLFGFGSLVASMMAMTIFAGHSTEMVAFVMNIVLWVIMAVICVFVWLASGWNRNKGVTTVIFSIICGYGAGIVMYWIYLTTYLWKF